MSQITEQQHQILEQLNLAVVVIDENGFVQYCNQLASMIFGQSKRKLCAGKLWDVLIQHTFPERLLAELWQDDRSFIDDDVELQFADGRQLVTEVIADSITIEGKRYCLLQLRQNDNLRRITQENTQKHHISASRHLIRGLAHEIKNPLGGIRGAAQLLSRSLDSAELTEYTQLIIEQADRLKDLVDRLLGPNTLPKQVPTNIHLVLERIVNLMNLDKPLDVHIERDYDPSLPSTLLDPNLIEQAILNIVVNGIQALAGHQQSNKQLTIQTRFAGSKLLHNKVHKKVLKIVVADNGPGIDESLLDTIFYPLVSSKSDGNGLGLSITQTLIDQHKGKIEVSSKPGHTEFAIYLPVMDINEE